MSLDRLERPEVRLGIGRVYLVPRALLEGLVRACPLESLALIQEAGSKEKYSSPLGKGVGHPLPEKRAFPNRNGQEGH
jgi:hypothetical protein